MSTIKIENTYSKIPDDAFIKIYYKKIEFSNKDYLDIINFCKKLNKKYNLQIQSDDTIAIFIHTDKIIISKYDDEYYIIQHVRPDKVEYYQCDQTFGLIQVLNLVIFFQ